MSDAELAKVGKKIDALETEIAGYKATMNNLNLRKAVRDRAERLYMAENPKLPQLYSLQTALIQAAAAATAAAQQSTSSADRPAVVLEDVIVNLQNTMQSVNAWTRRIEFALRDLSSSYHGTPSAFHENDQGEERPVFRRGIRPDRNNKATKYSSEWNKILVEPQNQNYGVEITHGEDSGRKIFKVFYQQQHNATRRYVFSCNFTHEEVKRAFLAFGLCSYDMRTFESFVQADGNFPPVIELSPFDDAISRYNQSTSSSQEARPAAAYV